MQVFFTPNIKQISYTLTKEESAHCIKVLRMKIGDQVCMIDGKGGLYYGIIDDPNVNKCVIRVIEKIEQYGRKNYNVHLAIAPTKNMSRFEWFLEKVTEIGVNEITPILCKRSERKSIKLERLNKIILSAMKQSVTAYMPKLNELTKFYDFVKNTQAEAKFIAHCLNNSKPSLKSQITNKQSIVVMIGPEGDFTIDEINLAIENKFAEVHLGKNRLRTETAGVVACHTINLLKDEG